MRIKLFLSFVLVLVLAGTVQAQEPEAKPYRVYLPVVSKMYRQTCSNGAWRLLQPEHTVNLILNPSAEAAGNYGPAGGGAVARSTDFSLYGRRSYQVTTAANGDGISLTTATLASAAHYATLRVHGTLPPAWRVGIAGNLKAPHLIERIDQSWALYGVAFSAAEAGGAAALTVTQFGAGASTFFIDGIQLEALGHWTSYVDGSQPDCKWLGTEHAATSERSAAARTGGRPRDFLAFGLLIEEMIGAGAPPVSLDVRGYAILPGGSLAGSKLESRELVLVGTMSANSKAELHAKRQRLSEVLLGAGGQPIRLEYTGSLPVKSADCIYAGGLESSLPVTYGNMEVVNDGWQNTNTFEEKIPLQFTCSDPAFYSLAENSVTLDTDDAGYFHTVAGRLKSIGQWNVLGPPADGGGAAYTNVRAIAEDATCVYWGGAFANFDTDPNADNIVRYNKQTGAWSNIGAADDIVLALTVNAQGHLIAGGFFANIGGVAAACIAEWDGAAWSALGAGMGGGVGPTSVNSLAVGPTGLLYAGGNFTTAGGGAANYVASWDGGSWSALAAGLTGGVPNSVDALAIGPGTPLYAGGTFTTSGATAVLNIAQWDGTAWTALGDGLNSGVFALALAPDSTLYAGGAFIVSGSISLRHVGKWNGTSWEPLGYGTNNTINSLALGDDNVLYASGIFTLAGTDLYVADRMAKWTGGPSGAWAHVDLNLPASPTAYAILSGPADPAQNGVYDLWLGFDTLGTGHYGGAVDADNGGNMLVYPKAVFDRTDSRPLATGTLETLRNETADQEILFNYLMQPGERVTVDLSSSVKSVTSSINGLVQQAVLANCDFGTWALQPGVNNVTSFITCVPNEQNDNTLALDLWEELSGVSEDNTDDGRLYVSILADGGGWFHVEMFKDVHRLAVDRVGHTASYNGVGLQAIIEDNASGLGGHINITAWGAVDIDIFVDFALFDAWLIWRDTFNGAD